MEQALSPPVDSVLRPHSGLRGRDYTILTDWRTIPVAWHVGGGLVLQRSADCPLDIAVVEIPTLAQLGHDPSEKGSSGLNWQQVGGRSDYAKLMIRYGNHAPWYVTSVNELFLLDAEFVRATF
jgi:hypothetical protein